MASEIYNTGVSPTSIVRADEEANGLMANAGFGGGVRKRRKDRFNGSGRDKLTMAEMKVSLTGYWKLGDTYVEIADKINREFNLEGDDTISAHNVQYHITSLLKSARKLALANITERQAMVLARYEQLEWIATEAYFASMSAKTTSFEKMTKEARSKEREKQLLKDLQRERKRVEKLNEVHRERHEPLERVDEPDHIIGDFPFILEKTHQNMKKFKKVTTNPAGDPRWVAMLIDINDKKAQLFGLKNKRDDVNPDQELARLPDAERTERLGAIIHAALSRKTGDRGMLAKPSPLGGFKEDPVEDVPEVEDGEVIEVDATEVPEVPADPDAWDWD